MQTAAELRAMAAKVRRLKTGHTPADIAMMETYALECEALADKAAVAEADVNVLKAQGKAP